LNAQKETRRKKGVERGIWKDTATAGGIDKNRAKDSQATAKTDPRGGGAHVPTQSEKKEQLGKPKSWDKKTHQKS